MKPTIKINDSAHECVIDIEGIIGLPEASQFDADAPQVATYARFREQVARLAQISAPEVVVNIRSMGGDVNDAMLIYEALRSLDARITTRCYGYTASAATIIAQAASGGAREISANGLYLIHNSICAIEGNADAFAKRIDLLRKTDERIAGIYAARSGRDVAHFVALMSENGGEGRWLTPAEAIEAGLADCIVGDEPAAERGIVRDVVERVAQLLGVGKIAPQPAAPLPKDKNILHFGEVELSAAASVVAFEEGQSAAAPTTVRECDDPSDADARPTPNALAYDADARGMRRA